MYGGGYSVDLVSGPDGNLWFGGGSGIVRYSIGGAVQSFSTSSLPSSIVAGPDGNLWFTESQGMIGEVTTAGVVTEYAVSGTGSSGYAKDIAVGSDGNLWFVELSVQKIGRITTAGAIAEFPCPPSTMPFAITAGPDGNLWVSLLLETFGPPVPQIGTMTTSGIFTAQYSVPSATSLITGPDGHIWFAEDADQIGVLTDSYLKHSAVGPWSTAAPYAENGGAFTGHLANLNANGGFGGSSGWRLPTIAELQSIIADYPKAGTCSLSPCIDSVFGSESADTFWTATSDLSDQSKAWIINFGSPSGVSIFEDSKLDTRAVRAVRGGF